MAKLASVTTEAVEESSSESESAPQLKVCVRPGCSRKHVAKGLCANHYAAMKKSAIKAPVAKSARRIHLETGTPAVEVQSDVAKAAGLESVPDAQWRRVLGLCAYFNKDPRALASELFATWVSEIDAKLAEAKISI